jgi:hypothetical protein
MSRRPINRWIQPVMARHKHGALHRQLHFPIGEPIPVELLAEAIAHPEKWERTHAMQLKLKRRAQLVLTLRGFHKKKGK